MTNTFWNAAKTNRPPGSLAWLKPAPRSAAIATFLLLALPLLGQYSGNNVTPAGSASAGLTGTSSTGGSSVGATGAFHAIVYDNNLNQTTDLHPAGATTSIAKGTDGVEQVGYSRSSMAYYDNCTIWKGSAASAITLTPSGASGSWCLGTDGGREIGWDYRPFYIYATQHAILWSGSANSYVDLHSFGTYSRGRAIHGGEEVGEVDSVPVTDPDNGTLSGQAVLWHDTAASIVSLNPFGYLYSSALATNGTQEGGWARLNNTTTAHAMMWSGSAASAVDLHPAGYFDTRVSALSATMQAGDGWVGGAAHTTGAHRHALAWTGSAASVIDLNVYVPAGYTDSVATGIDSAGNVVGYAFKTPTLGDHIPVDAIAVVFAATPGPSAPISSLTLSPAAVNPGDTLTGLVTLASPAAAGGATVSFISNNPALVPTPASVQVPEGQSTTSFVTPVSSVPLTAVTSVTIVGVTGSVRRAAAPLTVSPVVVLSSLAVTPVQGGNQTFGTVSLNLPAIVPVTVSLSADNAVISIPATVTILPGQTNQSFTITSAMVTTATPVTVTASFNGTSLQAVENVSTTVPIVLSSLTIPSVIGGATFVGTVTLNHPAYLGGVTIAVTSSNPALAPVPATITIPYGSSTGYISGVAGAVVNASSITLTASLNGVSVSGSFQITNGPGATIVGLDYWAVSHLIKVSATTTIPSGTLSFGTSPNGPALGLLAIEPTSGQYQGSASMSSAPSVIWVWNSAGGVPVSSTAVRTRSK